MPAVLKQVAHHPSQHGYHKACERLAEVEDPLELETIGACPCADDEVAPAPEWSLHIGAGHWIEFCLSASTQNRPHVIG